MLDGEPSVGRVEQLVERSGDARVEFVGTPVAGSLRGLAGSEEELAGRAGQGAAASAGVLPVSGSDGERRRERVLEVRVDRGADRTASRPCRPMLRRPWRRVDRSRRG